MEHSSLLNEALSCARQIALDSERNVIDVSTVVLGIMRSDSAITSIFPDTDRDAINADLGQLDAELSSYPLEGDAVPMTKHVVMIFNYGRQYAREAGDGVLDVYHILLAVLSFRNEVATAFKKRGWIFENFLAGINQFMDPPIEVERMESDIVPSITEPYSKLRKKFWAEDYKAGIVNNLASEAGRLMYIGKYPEARQVLNVVLDIDKANPYAIKLPLICLYYEKQYQAVIDYAKTITIDDDNLRLCLSDAYIRCGQPEPGLEMARALTDRHADLHNNAGFNLNKLGRYDEAINEFDRALELNSNYAFAYNNKGYALLKSGRTQEAKDAILHSLTLDKGNAYAYHNLALANIAEGNKADALENIEKALFYRYRHDFGDDIDAAAAAADAL